MAAAKQTDHVGPPSAQNRSLSVTRRTVVVGSVRDPEDQLDSLDVCAGGGEAARRRSCSFVSVHPAGSTAAETSSCSNLITTCESADLSAENDQRQETQTGFIRERPTVWTLVLSLVLNVSSARWWQCHGISYVLSEL